MQWTAVDCRDMRHMSCRCRRYCLDFCYFFIFDVRFSRFSFFLILGFFNSRFSRFLFFSILVFLDSRFFSIFVLLDPRL